MSDIEYSVITSDVIKSFDCNNKCAQILLNLLNKLRNSDKILGKPRILSLFLNLFDKFNT